MLHGLRAESLRFDVSFSALILLTASSDESYRLQPCNHIFCSMCIDEHIRVEAGDTCAGCNSKVQNIVQFSSPMEVARVSEPFAKFKLGLRKIHNNGNPANSKVTRSTASSFSGEEVQPLPNRANPATEDERRILTFEEA